MLNKKTSLLFLPFRLRMLLCKIDGWIFFRLAYLLKKPYFGSYLNACMQPEERLAMMKKLIELEINKSEDFKILEVGSWAGHSASLWASVCKKYQKGKVYCIDTWLAPDNIPEQKMIAKKDKIMNLFLHNIKTGGFKSYVVPLRMSSDEAFTVLREDIFNFIYIDGDHSYSQVIKDLKNYSKLCKKDGIICGDDLPVMTIRDDLDEFFKEHKEENAIRDPITRINCCPGVFLAIKEFFGRDGVSMKDGFWAVKKTDKGFEKVDL